MKKAMMFLLAFFLMITGIPIGSNHAAKAEEEQKMKQDAWYVEMCENAMLNAGNNKRLKKVIERTLNGEEITIATIGGSITEGAGAATYNECWARKVLDGFRERYASADPTKVGLVNAGVGGTASTFGWMRWERDILS